MVNVDVRGYDNLLLTKLANGRAIGGIVNSSAAPK
jgi:hypothetical protein